MSPASTREELAAERRRLLEKARRHERRADRIASIQRPLRSVTTALLRADLKAAPACLVTEEPEVDDDREHDYHPRAWGRR